MSTPQLATEACENCGRLIGRLETPHVLGENIVCAECHAILAPHLHPVPYATPESAAQSSIGSTGENKDAVFCLALLLAGAGLLVLGYISGTNSYSFLVTFFCIAVGLLSSLLGLLFLACFVFPIDQEAFRLKKDQDARIVCPHCKVAGHVRTEAVTLKKGVDGGKATAAVITAGLSVLATGLSRKEDATKAHCSNCGVTWYI